MLSVSEAKKALEEAQAAERRAKQESERAWSEYKKSYKYSVRFTRGLRGDPIALHITRTIERDEGYLAMEAKYGPYCWEEVRNSVGYLRDEEGVLAHVGGGYLMLLDGQPISQEDWAALKAGDIATIEKWVRD